MRVYYDNIEPQDNHTYFHQDLGNVMSVTTILNNGKNSNAQTEYTIKGTNIHKTIEFWLKSKIKESRDLYDSLDDASKKKAKDLVEAIKKLDLANSNAELSFVATDDKIKYGGTVDLLTENIAIDFKTGNLNSKYLHQISAYAISNKKQQGLILWFNHNNQVEKTILNKKEIEDYYNEFHNKASNLLSVVNPFDIEIEGELQEFSSIKQAIAELTQKLDITKANIETKLQSNGYKSYKLKNFTCFNQKGKETVTLTKEAKTLLLEKYPSYFKTNIGKPSFIIKGN